MHDLVKSLDVYGLEVTTNARCKLLNWLPSSKSGTYTGWNSGGYLDTLEKEQPESWATAVVHMFLSELDNVISARIQQLILNKYKVRYPSKVAVVEENGAREAAALNKLLEIEILLQDKPNSLSDVLDKHIIKKYLSKNEATLRREPSKAARSALLFGPPGTSKTKLIEAIASDLQWPMLELTPSEFVKGSLAKIYVQADEIFEDLMDLSGVVVFFDEMDALVQTREGGSHLDIESQFLTTTMLPKLTRLYDQARVLFFMATNYQERFDPAIKRPGRFDLLLCMGPPTLKDKTERLHIACSLETAEVCVDQVLPEVKVGNDLTFADFLVICLQLMEVEQEESELGFHGCSNGILIESPQKRVALVVFKQDATSAKSR